MLVYASSPGRFQRLENSDRMFSMGLGAIVPLSELIFGYNFNNRILEPRL